MYHRIYTRIVYLRYIVVEERVGKETLMVWPCRKKDEYVGKRVIKREILKIVTKEQVGVQRIDL